MKVKLNSKKKERTDNKDANEETPVEKTEKKFKAMSNLEFTKFAMDHLNVNQEFCSMGIPSNKISAMKFEGKKFQTSKRVVVDSVDVKADLCFVIRRIE